MTSAPPARTDRSIKAAVQDELAWTPDVDADGVGVAVEDGAVSLAGEVDSYPERLAATRAALRVRGVNAVVDNLAIHPDSRFSVSETDIAKEVAHALKWSAKVPDTVKAKIHGHHVTLTGQVQWDFQRNTAVRAVQHLRGVTSVDNRITLSSRPSAADAEHRIKDAFQRNAQLDADNVNATISGNSVTLTGTVWSWAEKRQAEKAAWASPHVTHVNNQIVVRAY